MPRPIVRIHSDRLRRARQAHEWTQAQLGARVGIGQSYVAQIEGGACVPPIRTLHALCRELGLPIDFVLTEDEPQAVSS